MGFILGWPERSLRLFSVTSYGKTQTNLLTDPAQNNSTASMSNARLLQERTFSYVWSREGRRFGQGTKPLTREQYCEGPGRGIAMIPQKALTEGLPSGGELRSPRLDTRGPSERRGRFGGGGWSLW